MPLPLAAGGWAWPFSLLRFRGLDAVLVYVAQHGKVHVDGKLEHVDVRLGAVNVLVGENGAGKTTLMQLIAGELRPSAGNNLFVFALPDRN